MQKMLKMRMNEVGQANSVLVDAAATFTQFMSRFP